MKDSTTKNKTKIKKIIYLFVWLIIWEICSNKLNNDLLLPYPKEVFKKIYEMLGLKTFWYSLLNTSIKIGLGLIIGILIGIILALLSYKSEVLKNFILLPLDFIRSVPIASIIVILLIWIDSYKLSIHIVILVTLPMIYSNIYEGLSLINKDIVEMSNVFKVKKTKKIKYIYIPHFKKQLLGVIYSVIGFAWKSGISAETFGMVSNSIGEEIYYSKLYLDSTRLFAWTIIIVIFSKIFSILAKIIIEDE